MSIGPGSLPLASSLAGTSLAQARGDVERVQQHAGAHTRAVQSQQHAQAAAGIGQLDADSQSSDRDADGRRLWEEPADASAANDPNAAATDAPPTELRSLDATGTCGTHIDLTG